MKSDPTNPANPTNPNTLPAGNDNPPADDNKQPNTPPEKPAEKSGFNWTLALIIAFILLALGAIGIYLYKKGQV